MDRELLVSKDLTYKRDKLEIVKRTLTFQATIPLFRLLTLFVFRLILSSHAEGPSAVNVSQLTTYVASLAMTIGERSTAAYFDAKWQTAAGSLCKYTGSFCQQTFEGSGTQDFVNCTTIVNFWSYESSAAPWAFPEYCPDLITKALGTGDGAQPWWMIPVVQGLDAVLMYYFIGFDLNFKLKERHSKFEYFKKFVITSVFIALVLKRWMLDISLLLNAAGQDWLNTLILRLSILLMSGNFIKAITLWGGFQVQAPVAAFRCKPKYQCMPLCEDFGFPLSPFATVWLHPMKWLYAMLLAPYLMVGPLVQILPKIFFILATLAACCIRCFICTLDCISCGPCIAFWKGIKSLLACGPCISCWLGCCKPAIFGFVSALGAVFSLFCWKFARECFWYWSWIWFRYPWSVFALILLQIWSSITPAIATFLYACLLCSSSKERKEVAEDTFEEAFKSSFTMSLAMINTKSADFVSLRPKPLSLDYDERKTLFELDVESANQDFEPPVDFKAKFAMADEVYVVDGDTDPEGNLVRKLGKIVKMDAVTCNIEGPGIYSDFDFPYTSICKKTEVEAYENGLAGTENSLPGMENTTPGGCDCVQTFLSKNINTSMFVAAFFIVMRSFIAGLILLFTGSLKSFISSLNLFCIMMLSVAPLILNTPFLSTLRAVHDMKLRISKKFKILRRVTGQGVSLLFLGWTSLVVMRANSHDMAVLTDGILFFVFAGLSAIPVLLRSLSCQRASIFLLVCGLLSAAYWLSGYMVFFSVMAIILNTFVFSVSLVVMLIGVMKSRKLYRCKRLLKRRDIDEVFSKYSMGYLGLTPDEFKNLTKKETGIGWLDSDLKLIFGALVSNPGDHFEHLQNLTLKDLKAWVLASTIFGTVFL